MNATKEELSKLNQLRQLKTIQTMNDVNLLFDVLDPVCINVLKIEPNNHKRFWMTKEQYLKFDDDHDSGACTTSFKEDDIERDIKAHEFVSVFKFGDSSKFTMIKVFHELGHVSQKYGLLWCYNKKHTLKYYMGKIVNEYVAYKFEITASKAFSKYYKINYKPKYPIYLCYVIEEIVNAIEADRIHVLGCLLAYISPFRTKTLNEFKID